jgi:hypothetical protein
MKMIKLICGGVVATALAFSASNAHAIAFQNPTKAQVNQIKAQLKTSIMQSPVFKNTPGGKVKLTYTPGTPTIGPDRSNTRPTINALILGKKGAMGMADNHERTYVLSVAGAKVSAQAEGKWEQLMTGALKPATK